ncbi:ATP-binding protein [Robiginitalea sp. M366]|uniref:ATP-binding protein n=1 Tax=Robiginitalea aestuariiviva TaxID=3036903 RepID=UPI00240DB77B|nr:ATP-binding protein [Robiginitalea aestuariiviva]MDG1571630.1 ATP-binding protein [Robiginitalea aestuariiviva]
MINKRLLIKSLLAHNDENSFYDKKRFIDIGTKQGKAKFLKHVCALANSNPANRSYIVVGVEDADNAILGVDFFDDSKIQNLVNAYLDHPPKIAYENVQFPNLPEGKVVGLVTISASGKVCALRKNIWKYFAGMVFFREGSISKPVKEAQELVDVNSEVVGRIEQHARNNIELTLDGVIDFINYRHPDLPSHYRVFKEQFVVCWAGHRKVVKEQEYLSRVDIELINEQVKLFYSALDEVSIRLDENSFTIVEYVYLGLERQKHYYPLEQVAIRFRENGAYHIESELIFEPPQYERKTLHHIYNSSTAVLTRLRRGIPLKPREWEDLVQVPSLLLICYLNGFENAREVMLEARTWMKGYHPDAHESLKEALRILRKVRYS